MKTWYRESCLRCVMRSFGGPMAALFVVLGMMGGCKSANAQSTGDASASAGSARSYAPERDLEEARRQAQSFGESVWTDVIGGPLYRVQMHGLTGYSPFETPEGFGFWSERWKAWIIVRDEGQETLRLQVHSDVAECEALDGAAKDAREQMVILSAHYDPQYAPTPEPIRLTGQARGLPCDPSVGEPASDLSLSLKMDGESRVTMAGEMRPVSLEEVGLEPLLAMSAQSGFPDEQRLGETTLKGEGFVAERRMRYVLEDEGDHVATPEFNACERAVEADVRWEVSRGAPVAIEVQDVEVMSSWISCCKVHDGPASCIREQVYGEPPADYGPLR